MCFEFCIFCKFEKKISKILKITLKYSQECKQSDIAVASTMYPLHKQHIKKLLIAFNLVRGLRVSVRLVSITLLLLLLLLL